MSVEANPAFLQNLTYSAEITRRAEFYMLQRGASIGSVAGGLVGAGDLSVTYAGSGLNVSVAAGECVVPGSSSATQSGYYLRNTTTLGSTPAAANPSNPRVDLVYAQVQDAAYAGSSNDGVIAIATGTPTPGASLSNLSGAPSLPTSALALAYVLVPANASSITNTDIANVALPVKLGVPTSARLVAAAAGVVPGGTTMASYFLSAYGGLVASGNNVYDVSLGIGGVQGLFNFTQADWTLGANTPELTVKLTTFCNGTGAGQPMAAQVLDGLTVAGSTNSLTVTLGGLAFETGTVTPVADTIQSAESSVPFPASGTYCLAIATGGTTAAASLVGVNIQLWANA